MNEFILNYYDLYSDSDLVVYQAVLKKKDWMFRQLFIPCDFHPLMVDNLTTYPDIFGLMDQSFVFQKLVLNPTDFKEHENEIGKINREFNKKFRVRYCYEKIVPTKEESTFWVEMDFSKIDKKTYNDLVCNFYPCIEKVEDLDLFYNAEKDIDLLKYPMLGEKGKWVFILDLNLLLNDRLYLPCVKKIWYNSHNLDQLKIDTLKEIADANDLPLGDYYGK